MLDSVVSKVNQKFPYGANIKELSSWLCVKRHTLYQEIEVGKLKAKKVPTKYGLIWRCKSDDIIQYLENKE